MLPISQCERSFGGTLKTAVILLALLVLALFPDDLAAQGLPVETGSHLPVALWFIGAAVLGLVIAYGIMRNRSRTRAEKHITEQAATGLATDDDRTCLLLKAFISRQPQIYRSTLETPACPWVMRQPG